MASARSPEFVTEPQPFRVIAEHAGGHRELNEVSHLRDGSAGSHRPLGGVKLVAQERRDREGIARVGWQETEPTADRRRERGWHGPQVAAKFRSTVVDLDETVSDQGLR